MSRKMSARAAKNESSPTAQPEQGTSSPAAEQTPPRPGQDPAAKGFRFDDPYWDDAFDSWHNPTLRTCCR